MAILIQVLNQLSQNKVISAVSIYRQQRISEYWTLLIFYLARSAWIQWEEKFEQVEGAVIVICVSIFQKYYNVFFIEYYMKIV